MHNSWTWRTHPHTVPPCVLKAFQVSLAMIPGTTKGHWQGQPCWTQQGLSVLHNSVRCETDPSAPGKDVTGDRAWFEHVIPFGYKSPWASKLTQKRFSVAPFETFGEIVLSVWGYLPNKATLLCLLLIWEDNGLQKCAKLAHPFRNGSLSHKGIHTGAMHLSTKCVDSKFKCMVMTATYCNVPPRWILMHQWYLFLVRPWILW